MGIVFSMRKFPHHYCISLLLSLTTDFVSLAGFVCSVNKTHIATGWTRMYEMSYIVNLAIATAVYCVLSLVFPPEGAGIAEQWHAYPLNGTPPNESVASAVLEDKEEHTVQVECVSPPTMV